MHEKKCVALCVMNGCAPDGGRCDVDLGVCRGCVNDDECGGDNPRCDDATGRCVVCNLGSRERACPASTA